MAFELKYSSGDNTGESFDLFLYVSEERVARPAANHHDRESRDSCQCMVIEIPEGMGWVHMSPGVKPGVCCPQFLLANSSLDLAVEKKMVLRSLLTRKTFIRVSS